ncbi:sugar phosphate isomerase/epimerase family protein [Streptomyces sp. NPDC007861]|uniref:sugar phosphate isomerase/epimerase family protein n=1 Tax=Streptomyces sp. NPDC007861 TaxID=3154893 RepID=UPI0033C0DD9F
MELAFSTLGVPGMPLDEVLALATGSGYEGVELRAAADEPVNPGLDAAERAGVAERFAASGVTPLTIAAYAGMAQDGPDEPVVEEALAAVRLAAGIGAGHVRVFPRGGDLPPSEADANAVRRLAAVAPVAADLGVRVLLETHDSHSTAAAVSRVLDRVDHPGVGAIWDLMHTWRADEDPQDSYRALAPHLAYVQVKDIASRTDTTPLPLGAGVLPLAACVDSLRAGGYRGWLCWEYEALWYSGAPALPPLLPAGARLLRGLGA